MKSRTPSRFAAFTLVELLVSMSILTLLTALVVQVMNSATTAIVGTGKRLGADAQARMIFDRMAMDFSKMLKRRDADYIFEKPSGNDFMYFYSEVPSFYNGNSGSKSSLSLVGYRINPNNPYYPNIPVLERLGKGLSWDGASNGASAGSAVFLTYPATSPTPYPESTLKGNWPNTVSAGANDADFAVIGDQVYRLEISFLLTDGTISNTPSLAGNSNANGLQDVSAIIVAIAILDSTSQKMSSDTSKLVSALGDSVNGYPTAQTWSGSSYLTESGIPQAAASQLRIYQRYFYIR